MSCVLFQSFEEEVWLVLSQPQNASFARGS